MKKRKLHEVHEPRHAFLFKQGSPSEMRLPMPCFSVGSGVDGRDLSSIESGILDKMNDAFSPLALDSGDMNLYYLVKDDSAWIFASTLKQRLYQVTDAMEVIGVRGPGMKRFICAHVQSKIKNADALLVTWSRASGWEVKFRRPPRTTTTCSGTIRVFPFQADVKNPGMQIVEGRNPLVDTLAMYEPQNVSIPASGSGPLPLGGSVRMIHIECETEDASAVFIGSADCIVPELFGAGFKITHQPFNAHRWPRFSGWYNSSWSETAACLIEEVTRIPSCLVGVISSFTGAWTVDLEFFLPAVVRSHYSTVSNMFSRLANCGLGMSITCRTSVCLNAVGTFMDGQFKLHPPQFNVVRDGRTIAIHHRQTRWLALAKLIHGLCKDGGMTTEDGKPVTPPEAAAMLSKMLLDF